MDHAVVLAQQGGVDLSDFQLELLANLAESVLEEHSVEFAFNYSEGPADGSVEVESAVPLIECCSWPI